MREEADREECHEALPSGHGTVFAHTNMAAAVTGTKPSLLKLHMEWGWESKAAMGRSFAGVVTSMLSVSQGTYWH